MKHDGVWLQATKLSVTQREIVTLIQNALNHKTPQNKSQD